MHKLASVLLVSAAIGLGVLASAPAGADDLLAGVPAPANSTKLGAGDAQGGGQQVSYSTPETPSAVIAAFTKDLAGSGWTVAGSGESGGGYGGGGGLQATKGDLYLALDAGGPSGRTFVHVCVWPSKPKNDHCGD